MRSLETMIFHNILRKKLSQQTPLKPFKLSAKFSSFVFNKYLNLLISYLSYTLRFYQRVFPSKYLKLLQVIANISKGLLSFIWKKLLHIIVTSHFSQPQYTIDDRDVKIRTSTPRWRYEDILRKQHHAYLLKNVEFAPNNYQR